MFVHVIKSTRPLPIFCHVFFGGVRGRPGYEAIVTSQEPLLSNFLEVCNGISLLYTSQSTAYLQCLWFSLECACTANLVAVGSFAYACPKNRNRPFRWKALTPAWFIQRSLDSCKVHVRVCSLFQCRERR